MHTKLFRGFVILWRVLSEVPGWPDAPVLVRLRRVAPILVAILGMLALGVWKYGWHDPQIRAMRASHAPLLTLEEEVAALRLACSDQQAQEIATRAQQADTALVADPDDVAAVLRKLRERLLALGWDATFQAYDAVSADTGAAATPGIVFAAARAELVPVKDNTAPFKSLLGVFDQISATNERIDLTRLGVRADESGKLAVELNLRVACRVPHEEAS